MGRGANTLSFASYAQPAGRASRARLLDTDGETAAQHAKDPISVEIDFVVWPRAGQQPDDWDGATIAKGIHSETGEVLSLKGKFGPVQIGDRIEIFDRKWQDDNRYGEYLRVWRSRRDMSTREGIISYLQTLPGVGPALAEAIVDQLGGAGCLDRIDADPDVLLDVRTPSGYGIRKEFMAELAQEWAAHKADRTTMIYLHSLDLGDATAKRIFEHFGAATEDVIKDDPYRMTEVSGIGFRQADRVAQRLGIEANDPRRLAAGVEYVIAEAENDGHICLTRDAIFERAPHLLRRDGTAPSVQQINQAIDAMLGAGRLHAEVDYDDDIERIYTHENYVIETRLYDHLKKLLLSEELPAPAGLAKRADSILTDEQFEAVKRSFTERLSILTGGPGTGKTTTLRELIQACESQGQRVLCMAPTGKAAKRMEESTGHEASTIHRALGFQGRSAPKSVSQGADVNEGYGFDADVVVVDETSMLDMKLAERLLSNIGPETRLVMVGDPDQLPAVGAGSVLLDLIASERVPTTKLTKIHRQAEGSLITVNAHRIRQGLEPFYTREEAEAELGHAVKDDFHFVEVADGEHATKALLRQHRAAPERLGLDRDDVMLLAPQRKGDAGVWILNRAIQQMVNPDGDKVRGGDEPLRVGDRIINVKNRYAADGGPDVMNGDMGEITSYDAKTKTASVRIDGESTHVRYSGKEDLESLRPGYALTIHKSQGSEAPLVLMAILATPGSNRLLTRNLVYTGLTRARDKAVIVGTKESLRLALRRDGSKRNTTLDLRIGRVEQRLLERKERLLSVAAGNSAAVRDMLLNRGNPPATQDGKVVKPAWMDPDNRPAGWRSPSLPTPGR